MEVLKMKEKNCTFGLKVSNQLFLIEFKLHINWETHEKKGENWAHEILIFPNIGTNPSQRKINSVKNITIEFEVDWHFTEISKTCKKEKNNN